MTKISEHITYEEATQSNTAIRKGIDNTPNEDQLKCMREVAEKCFEPMREFWGKPLTVNSFFRSSKLNYAIGGQPTSQHMLGEAIDIGTGSLSGNKKLIEWAKENLIFDQLIWEFGTNEGPAWVHVSFTSRKQNRNQYLEIGKK
jgi:hypothetical protein